MVSVRIEDPSVPTLLYVGVGKERLLDYVFLRISWELHRISWELQRTERFRMLQ